jgi:hypothetical protein
MRYEGAGRRPIKRVTPPRAYANGLTDGRTRDRTRARSASSVGLGVIVFVDVKARTEFGGMLDVSAIERPAEQ